MDATKNDLNLKKNEQDQKKHGLWKQLLHEAVEFAQTATMHGLGRISRKNSFIIARIFWLLLVLTGASYCIYVFYSTVTSFLAYPVVTKVRTRFESRSRFPAVTICNLNVYQRSQINETESAALSHVFGGYPVSENVTVNLADFDGLDVTELTNRAAFNYSNVFESGVCNYKEDRCNPDHFSLVLTDHGVCFKFDPSSSATDAFQNIAGSGGGLLFEIDFDPSDWTVGPYFYIEGFRIKLHEPGTTVHTLANDGIPLVPGFDTMISVKRAEKSYLSHPHGECGSVALQYFPTYKREDCFFECRTLHIVNICGCKMAYMPGPAPVCNLRQISACLELQTDPANAAILFDASSCNCPQDCTSTIYTPHAQLARFSRSYAAILNKEFGFDVSQNGVGFLIYYENLQYSEENEEALYSVERLLSDIGGAAGLFLGCSFLSIIEILYFIGEVLWLLILKCLNRNRKVEDSKS